MRSIAILNENKNAIENAKNLLNSLKHYNVTADITFFTKYPEEFKEYNDIKVIQIPNEKNNRPKMKNFVVRFFKENHFNDFLHVIEDKVQLNESPIKFIDDIENMMKVYDLNCWFDTITDGCNYVYSKYNPRLDIVIDNPEYLQKLKVTNAVFCSHSNVQWTVFNVEKADDNELYFNEAFDIDMFFIIEFLARRRNTHLNSLYFMNQYFTCNSEVGVFQINQNIKDDEQIDINDKMKKEDQMFRELNIDYSPDNNIDRVLELLYNKLHSKIK